LERWKIQRFMALDCCHLLAKVHCMTPEVTKILMIFRLLHKILILLNSNRSCMLRLHLRIWIWF
jgi:hypothetical protein